MLLLGSKGHCQVSEGAIFAKYSRNSLTTLKQFKGAASVKNVSDAAFKCSRQSLTRSEGKTMFFIKKCIVWVAGNFYFNRMHFLSDSVHLAKGFC